MPANAPNPIIRRFFTSLWLIILVVLIITHFLTLRSYPILRGVDEPGLLVTATQFSRTGKLDFSISLTNNGPLQARILVILSEWLQLAGDNWVVGRLFFLWIGFVLLAVIYTTGNRLYGRQAGLLATVFTAGTTIFFITAHYIRQDISLALVVALAVLAEHLASKTSNWSRHALVGLLLTLGYEAHPNVLIFLFAFAVYYIGYYGYRILLYRHYAPLGIIVGGLLGVALLVLLHVAPSVHEFQESVKEFSNSRGMPISAGTPLKQVWEDYNVSLNLYEQDARYEAVLSILILSAGLLYPRTRKLAVLYVLSQVGALLLISVYRPPYFVNGLPLLTLIIGGLFAGPNAAKWRLALGTILLGVLLVSTGKQVIPTARENWNSRIQNRIEQLQNIIPPDKSVFSSPMVVLGLGSDAHVVDYGVIGPIMRVENLTVEQVVDRINPDYVVLFVREVPQHHLAEYGGMDTRDTYLKTGTYLQDYYHLLATLPGVNGKMEVYIRNDLLTSLPSEN